MLVPRLAALILALTAIATAPVLTAGQQPPAPAGAQPAAPAPAGPPPAAPAPVVIDIQGAPALGPDNAPVTIVEFGDFQCPSCAQGAKALRRLHAIYPNRVRWVFKHYPLRTLHPQAALAHEAAVAAQEQGKFWEMHELIFRNQGNIRYRDLVGYAQEIGLDLGAFKDALETRRLRPRVIRDMEDARNLGVFATPTYYINGTRIIGARSTSEFRTLVDAIVRRPASPPAAAGKTPPGAAAPADGSIPTPVPAGTGSPPAQDSTSR